MSGNCGECTRRWFCNENPETCGAFPELPPPTNADRIRGMSDAGIAKEMLAMYLHGHCDCNEDNGLCITEQSLLGWLQQPAETEGTE